MRFEGEWLYLNIDGEEHVIGFYRDIISAESDNNEIKVTTKDGEYRVRGLENTNNTHVENVSGIPIQELWNEFKKTTYFRG